MRKEEIKYIVYSVGFALIWFFLVLPKLLIQFDSSNPLLQFLIFNLGLYIFLIIFLKSLVTEKSVFNSGVIGIILLFLALDLWLPEYHITIKGELIKGATLGISTDYVFGLFGQSLGINGILLYFFVYI